MGKWKTCFNTSNFWKIRENPAPTPSPSPFAPGRREVFDFQPYKPNWR
jgi:hypothetical protein